MSCRSLHRRLSDVTLTPLKALVCALALSGLSCGGAFAADGAGRFSVRGIGAKSCADYSAALADRAAVSSYASWLMGYASARNRDGTRTFDILPTQQGLDLVNIVAAICKGRQAMVVESAANEAVALLGPMRQEMETPLVRFEAGGKSVSIRQGALVSLQRALIDKKFFRGPADGAPGRPFAEALRSFQKAEGIAVTGLPDMDSFIRAILKR
ncbi:MAG: peptidoglycan-binding protein [Sphingomonadales bacterium]|nr:MAG: peptidoglycan-binding protein [Sphingomonadales bacterium]TNF03166.1 MAG: peptidoglycan-binding protein [Sphingomonadales bacterium]